jgi:hypothetical protein
MSEVAYAEARLEGELAPAPSAAWATVLYALSGIAFVRGAARTAGRLALAYRRPATLRLSARGLQITHRTELLGRVLRDRETLVPLQNVASITREVRYARIGLYAGLIALVVGTYIGAGLLVDGVRVPGGSPSLLGLGLGAIALGIVLDYVLAVVVDAVRETCQIVVKPYHGPALCIRGLAVAEADRVLAAVARATADLAGDSPSLPAAAVVTTPPVAGTAPEPDAPT